MPKTITEQSINFYTYPPIGGDDWQYTSQTARVRALEIQMLSRVVLHEMANAETFRQAVESLSGTDYALAHGDGDSVDYEQMLLARRADVRRLFSEYMLDDRVVALFRSRDDFANLRLALRRTLTGKPFGSDYSDEGNVPPGQLENILVKEEGLGGEQVPRSIQEAIEATVLAYYQDKDIRSIDYSLDAAQAQHGLCVAEEVQSLFLAGLFRIQIDLTNIRTMLRLKFTDSQQRTVFLQGGYVELERFKTGLDTGYESLGQLFFATPYHKLVDVSASYVASKNSFLKVEQQCEEHLIGFLKTTTQITAGPQPVIAYLLMKENEIRTVRLLLTAKKSSLDASLILDRIS